MASAAPPPPAFAPQNDNGQPHSQGAGARKKNRKKKSAAAKAAAAAAASVVADADADSVTNTADAAADAVADAANADADSVANTANADADSVANTADAAADAVADAAAVAPTPEPGNGTSHAEADMPHELAIDSPLTQQTPTHTDTAKTNGNGHVSKSATLNGYAATPAKKGQGDHGAAASNGFRHEGENEDGDQKSRPALPLPGDTLDTHTHNTHTHDTDIPDTDTLDGAMTQNQGQDELRAEADRLRQQVEQMQKQQSTHKEEMERLRAELEESEASREQAETQYQNLLGRVEKIKETLGERLKRDKQELEEANDRIDELESQNEALRQGGSAAEASAEEAEEEVKRLRTALSAAEKEQAALRGRAQLSQQNWHREKEDLLRQLQHVRAELESTTGAMGEWEVIAMEERSVREALAEKAADLEEQLAALREQSDRVAEERDAQERAVDSLQRALQEIQEARKRELRDMVESSEAQLEAAKTRARQAEAEAKTAIAEAESLRHELERTLPFEREVKEKNLLIGKLRHESIVLNDHLTKALRYIKKNKPEENVDRQVVTNHFLQFLALDRSDPKKFQILQVIAGVLNWTEEQKEKAGLARPGASGGSLRLPTSPFSRTPSTPSLNTEFFSEPAPGRESLADLWAGFLERSVEEAASESSAPSSRKGSLPRS